MKTSLIIKLLLLSALALHSCKGKGSNGNDTITAKADSIEFRNVYDNEFFTKYNCMTLLEKVLSLQIASGADYISMSHNIPRVSADEHFEVSIEIIDSLLTHRGYKKQSNQEFIRRVKDIFGETLFNIFADRNIIHFDLTNDPNPRCETMLSDTDNAYVYTEGAEGCGFHIIKNRQIISNFYYLPELIDYQTEYPEIAALEDREYSCFLANEGEMSLLRWKDIDDLPQRRERAIDCLFYRNNYLFNDSKSALTWLINNDELFLIEFMIKFGYDREPKINILVLEGMYGECQRFYENVHYNYRHCIDLLYRRDCDGSLRVNRGILATIKDFTLEEEDNRYLEMLGEYLINLNAGTLESDLSDEEKIELNCLFGGMELDILKNYPRARVRRCAYISSLLAGYRHNYQDSAKKHNYWGILNFEDIEQVSEWEYPIVNEGEDKEPFDYETLR